jgi:thiamine pyrophosphate-dependent acetolactate synthase large subunit-like protein
VLFEGDGGLVFHIQELETLKRCGYRILICAIFFVSGTERREERRSNLTRLGNHRHIANWVRSMELPR